MPLTEISTYDPDDDLQNDLVQMTNVDTPNILNTLRKRHKASKVYTSVGMCGIIISINPYKWIDIYGPNVMREHYEAFGTRELSPHVFSLAADAYKALCVHGVSQTIVTSGESGSGKTENSKQVFRFLAEVAGVQSGTSERGVSMQELLIQSNPVLEAFGNAKTLRNDNSSRFGKLVTVHFDSSGRIIGATTRNYLLEKTRVSTPLTGERNYHAFYMLLAGASADELASRGLRGVKEHQLVAKTTHEVAGFDDAAEWRVAVSAMASLGFVTAEVDAIVDVTASLLLLGDLEFVTNTSGATHADDPAAVKGGVAAVEKTAHLLGVDAAALATALTSIKVRETTNQLSVAAARKNRGAFVAAVYSRLFDRIVERINGAAGEQHEQSLTDCRSIGVLDIFGFEIFAVNSFEQLCINFANEKLQRNFTQTTFQAEEGLYLEEGIAFEHIDYIDNSAVLSLIDCVPVGGKGARGIIQILDEESHLPRTTNTTFLAKLNTAFGSEPGRKATGHKAYKTDFRKPTLFTVAHYAGQVTYTSDGFLEKSVENIALGLVTTLSASTTPLVASLFTKMSARRSVVAATAAGGGGGSRKPTVGLKFSRQLGKLIETIEATEAHFIRCIKPNSTKSASAFEAHLTLEQLKYSGAFEAVAIRKSGYPFRLTHRQFAHRYACVLAPSTSARLDFSEGGIRATVQSMVTSHLPTCEGLLAASAALAAAAGVPAPTACDLSDVKIGKTRAFYRAKENRALELAREAAIVPRLATMRRMARGAIARGARRRLKSARDELAAAVAAKELARLEAALAAALAPQRGFYQLKPLDFPLFLPNLAAITALLADLREEERVEPILEALVASDELSGPTYAQLRSELAIAAGLKERLGRAVPSLAAAECVVGMTDGVNEHDHERLSAALAAAEKLGVASRLAGPIQRARDEVARLESGKVLETALRAELAAHASVYKGGGGWDHSQIATEGLQAAVDAGLAHPLESKQGVALLAEARLSLTLRPILKADDWHALVSFLDGLPPTATTTEVTNASSELKDQCELRVTAMRAALSAGRAVRIGEARWDHGGITTAAVLEARTSIESFPYKSDGSKEVLAQAVTAVAIRNALLKCDWASVPSWAVLATTLEAVPPAQREMEEVQAAWSEFGEVRASLEAALQRALDTGRSAKRGGSWTHDEITTQALDAAKAAHDSFARPSDAGKVLSIRTERAAVVRRALLTASWPANLADVRPKAASTWGEVASELEQLGNGPAEAAAGREYDEVAKGREELNDARTHFESLVRAQMATGRSVKSGGMTWDHSGISTEDLEASILELMDFPRPSAATEELLAAAQLIVELRSYLVNAEWGAPATWGSLCDFVDSLDLQMRELEEVAAAKSEIVDRRKAGEATLESCLASGRSVKVGAGEWSHDGVAPRPLADALAGVKAFPRQSPEGTALAAKASAVIPVRTALLAVKPGDAATWGGVWDALEAVASDLRDYDEVASGWEEILAARAATEAAVKDALAKNRATRVENAAVESAAAPGGAGISVEAGLGLMRRQTLSRSYSSGLIGVAAALGITGDSTHSWSHEQLSTAALTAAVTQLRAFPRVSDTGVPLGKLADSILELRCALADAAWDVELATDGQARAGWAHLATWLEAASSGAYAREEEIVDACQAFADKRVSIEGLARGTLAVGRSLAPPKAGAPWERSELSAAGLRAGLDEIAAFPRTSETGRSLETLLRLMITLREALTAADWKSSATWAALADALDSGKAQTLATAEPVAQVRAEFEAKCAATEAAVQAALDTGRSIPTAGAPGGWSHSDIAVAPLKAARAELDSFPRPTAAGRRLSALGAIAIDVREALLTASFEKAASWGALARTIDASTIKPEAAELGELASAIEELDAARMGFEDAVSAELKRGRVTRHPASSARATAADLAARWAHGSISTTALLAAAAEHDAFPRPSAAGKALSSRARVAAAVREATAACDFARSASWAALFSAVDQAGRQLPPSELELIADYADARDELVDARLYTELQVSTALAAHRSVKVTSGAWSHADLSATELSAALAALVDFPRVSDEGRALEAQGCQVVAIRTALLKCDWASASTWGPLATALDAVPPEQASLEELANARAEFADKRDETVATVRTEMRKGASIRRGGGGGWDHSGIATAALDAATAEAAAFPRPAAETPKLLDDARAVSSLRTALLSAKVGASASWQPIATFLAMHAGNDDLDELRAAWQEMREARDIAMDVLTTSIANGCSRSVGEAKPWDHSSLDPKSLVAAAAELEAFPKLQYAATGAPPAMARRQSMMKRRSSLERVTEVAERLAASAKTLGRVRTLLLDNAWAELHSLLSTLEAGPPLHDLCAEEARRAGLELQDRKAFLEAAVTTALGEHRSKRTAAAGEWDHSELSTTELQAALVALRAFPLPGAPSLLKIGDFVCRVRELLSSSSWGELCGVLAGTSDAELMQNDEVRSAGIEVEEMRQRVVADLSSSLEHGRSLKIVGKKTKVFVDNSHFLPITWDHSGMGSGLEKLRGAVAAVGAFPGVSEREGVGPMLDLAALVLSLRELIMAEKWTELSVALESIMLPSHLTHDEVRMARQEYLTYELERATKTLDQRALKVGLASATAAGMLPIEKPVYQALGVFIDPPEFVTNLPKPNGSSPIEVAPDADGKLVLSVKVRGATTLQWTKNGIALKEGADGGRISGVATPTLTLAKMLNRDENQKLQCVAKNKFGIVKSHEVTIRLKGGTPIADVIEAKKQVAAAPAGNDDDDDDDAPGRRISLVDPVSITGEL